MRTALPVLLISSVAVVVLTGSRAPLPDAGIEPTRLVRTIELDGVGVAHPAGLAFSPEDGALLILHAGAGSQISGSAEIVTISPFADFLGSRLVSQSAVETSGLLYDGGTPRLFPTGGHADARCQNHHDGSRYTAHPPPHPAPRSSAPKTPMVTGFTLALRLRN